MTTLFQRILVPLSVAVTVGLGGFLATGCKSGKPSRAECRKAVLNVKRLAGTDLSDVGADPKAAIRICTANSSKETVKCMTKAQTKEELAACEGDVGEEYYRAEEEAEKERERKLKEKEDKEGDKDEDKDKESADDKPADVKPADDKPAPAQPADDTTPPVKPADDKVTTDKDKAAPASGDKAAPAKDGKPAGSE